MKFNERDGFDGLDENIKIYAAAANGDDSDGTKATVLSTMMRKKRRSL